MALFSGPVPDVDTYAALTDRTLRTIEERAFLAVSDPAGELEAVRPLGRVRARGILLAIAELRERRQPTIPRSSSAAELDQRALLDRLGADPDANKGTVACPAHEDRSPSLSWSYVDGKALVFCHAGCTFDEIRAAA